MLHMCVLAEKISTLLDVVERIKRLQLIEYIAR